MQPPLKCPTGPNKRKTHMGKKFCLRRPASGKDRREAEIGPTL